MAAPSRKWALITGASPGGMGEAETAAFMKRGVNVISTSIDTRGVKYLRPDPGTDDGFVVTMPLDVTSAKSIATAVQLAEQLTDGKLDFLLNNAGYGYLTPLLDVDIEKAKKQYDVNVWGTLAVTQAFFPMLRAAKGTVVNQASMSGVQGFNRPFAGIYSSSKAAIISLSNTLRIELSPFDINVVTLVTSAIKTEFFNHRSGGSISDISAYRPIKDEAEHSMHASEYADVAPDRYIVARLTIEQLLREPPPVILRNGYLANFIAFLFWLLPVWLLDIRSLKSSSLDRLRQISSEISEKKES